MSTDEQYEEIDPFVAIEDRQDVCQSDCFTEEPILPYRATRSVTDNMKIAGMHQFERKQVI